VKRHAGHRVLVDLEDEVVVEVMLDRALRALEQFFGFDGLSGQQLYRVHVLLLGRADVVVLVGMDERAVPMVVEHLTQQPFVERPVDHMHPRNAAVAGQHGVTGL
jgi:hypothetical protein